MHDLIGPRVVHPVLLVGVVRRPLILPDSTSLPEPVDDVLGGRSLESLHGIELSHFRSRARPRIACSDVVTGIVAAGYSFVNRGVDESPAQHIGTVRLIRHRWH